MYMYILYSLIIKCICSIGRTSVFSSEMCFNSRDNYDYSFWCFFKPQEQGVRLFVQPSNDCMSEIEQLACLHAVPIVHMR